MSEKKGTRFRSAEELGLNQNQLTVRPYRPQDEITSHSDLIMLPDESAMPVAATPTTKGSHVNKAKAFLIATLPLSFALAGSSALLALSLGFVGFWDVRFLVILLGVFSITLLLMYKTDKQHTPEGMIIHSEDLRHQRLMKQLDIAKDITFKILDQGEGEKDE